jgi:hypothetical protein
MAEPPNTLTKKELIEALIRLDGGDDDSPIQFDLGDEEYDILSVEWDEETRTIYLTPFEESDEPLELTEGEGKVIDAKYKVIS